jgi:hypothetical protein
VADCGSGPTKSMWRWLKRCKGLAMACGGDESCVEALALWQGRQSLHHSATWEARRGQTKRLAMSRLVARIPGWAKLCIASKMGRRKTAGTSGRKTPDDVSTIIDVLSILMVVTLRAEEETALWQSEHDGWAAASATRSTREVETGEETRRLPAECRRQRYESRTQRALLPRSCLLPPP